MSQIDGFEFNELIENINTTNFELQYKKGKMN